MLLARHVHHDEAEETGFKWLLAALGALPALSYVALLAFASAAFLSAGHWPAANYPDPKSISVAVVPLLWLAFAATACAVPIYAVVAVVHVWHARASLARVDVVGMALYVAGLALWLFGSRNLLLWFLD